MSGKKRANGEGSIRERYKGCWEGRYTAGYDLMTGKRIQKAVFAKTKKECAAKLAKAIRENTAPYFQKGTPPGDVALKEWLRAWFETYTKPNVRSGTIGAYTNIIENHIIPALGDIKLNKLTSMQIQRMYNETKERGRLNSDGEHLYLPLSNSFVRQIHMLLTGALKQAVKDRAIPYNPCDNCRIPKKEKKEMKVLPPDKIAPYLKAAKRNGVYSLFLLELTSGLRRGEILALLWSDLDVEKRILHINKQLGRVNGKLEISVPKTENSIRTVALPQQTVDALIEDHQRYPDSPLMFYYPRTNGYWSPDSLLLMHRKLLLEAGADQSIRFHDMRHTFATMAVQNGVDVKTVSSMLGHCSAGFTLDTYTHVTEEMRKGAADKMGIFMDKIMQSNEPTPEPPDPPDPPMQESVCKVIPFEKAKLLTHHDFPTASQSI